MSHSFRPSLVGKLLWWPLLLRSLCGMRLGNPAWLLCLPGVKIIMFHTHLHKYMMLLPERQTGDAWEPSKKKWSFENREATDRKIIHFFFFTWCVICDVGNGNRKLCLITKTDKQIKFFLIFYSRRWVGSCRCMQNVFPCHTRRRMGTRLVAANGSLNTLT